MVNQVLLITIVQGLATLIGFGFSVATTRLIAPDQWGLIFGQIWPFAAFGALTDFGLEARLAFILRKKEDPAVVATALALRMLPIIFIFLLVLTTKGNLLKNDLGKIYAILFLDFLLTKVGLIYKTVTECAGKRVLLPFIFETFFSLFGSVITLAMAAFFRPNWLALAAGLLFRSSTQALVAFTFSPIKKLGWPNKNLLSSFFCKQSAKLELSAILGMFLYDFFPFLLMRISGPLQAGLYSRSFSLATIPLSIVGALGRLSKRSVHQQTSQHGLAGQIISIQLAKALILLPALSFAIFFGPTALKILLGKNWQNIGLIFQLLCFYTLARSFYDDVTWVMTVAKNNATPFLVCQALQSAICLLFGPVLAYKFGAYGVAFTAAIAALAATALFWVMLLKTLEIKLSEFNRLGRQVFKQTLEFLNSTVARFVLKKNHFKQESVLMKNQTQKPKRILIVSQFQDSSTGYCYANLFKKLAQENEQIVQTLDCKKNYLNFFGKSSNQLPRPLRAICNLLTNLHLVFKCLFFGPDVVLLVKGENVWFRTLKLLKSLFSFKLVNFYPDSPFCFWNGNSTSDVLLSLPLYDRFAIWSKTLAPILLSSGAKQVFYWPFVADTNLFNPARVNSLPEEQKEEFKSEVCFVGQPDEKREKFLTYLVEQLPFLDLKIWGLGWKKRLSITSPLRAFIKGDELGAQDLCKAISGAKIVLNFLRDQNINSHNQRTFEVAAMRAFLLTERSTEQAEELFKEDESIACFRTKQELVEQVLKYLAEGQVREKIAVAARTKIEDAFDPVKLFHSLISF